MSRYRNKILFLVLLLLFLSPVFIPGLRNILTIEDGRIILQFAESGEKVTRESNLKTIPTPTNMPSATPLPYSVITINGPSEITEGEMAAFTWYVNGQPTKVNSTSIYYGKKSTADWNISGISPEDSVYTQFLQEFIQGEFNIPLTFVGNSKTIEEGKYYYRSYALINNRHYWSSEKSFLVKAVPKNEIKVIDFPGKIHPNENAAFTWEILGPQASTWYTVIAGSKESKSGEPLIWHRLLIKF